MRSLLVSLCLFFFTVQITAQIDGDNIFSTEQIIRIDLTFSQTSFWDSLTTNYETETYMKADLELTDVTGTYTFPDVGVRLKGNSSYGHPGNKKSFKIDFNKYTSGQNYDGLKKLNFSNGFKDPSMVREKLFFDVSREVGVPAPRGSFANVYFNGTLWGFYTVIEQIDDQFLDWKIKDDDGNLFKAGANFGGGPGGGGNEADLKYYGENQASYEERYELKSNEDENDWSDLIEFIDFINNSTDAVFENELENRMELDEYLHTIALDNLFSNLDSYTGSARNYYIYHNLTTDKWEWIKWDGNESFGLYRTGGPGGGVNLLALPIDYADNDRPLLEKVFGSEKLKALYEAAMCDIKNSYFNPTYLNPRLNAMKEMIEESVFADDNKMYTNANFTANIESDVVLGGGPMGGAVYGIKSFIEDKFNFIEGAIECAPLAVIENQVENFTISPNPTDHTIFMNFHEPTMLFIYNSVGQLVLESSADPAGDVLVDVSAFEKGVYFVSAHNMSNTTKYVSRFIKL